MLERPLRRRLVRGASTLEATCSILVSDGHDGFMSAITAWDWLKWRTWQVGTVRLSSPTELLDRINGTVEVVWLPETMEYGRREVGVRDPDGHTLAFAEAREGE